MAIPSEITTNSLLDSSKIRAWTTYFKNGKGILQDTYANLKTYAKTLPTEPFFCISTDANNVILMCYMGNATVGDEGFITLGGGTPIVPPDIG